MKGNEIWFSKTLKWHCTTACIIYMWYYDFKDQILHRELWRTTYNLKHQVLLQVLCMEASSGYSIQLDLEEVLSSIHQVICMAVKKII